MFICMWQDMWRNTNAAVQVEQNATTAQMLYTTYDSIRTYIFTRIFNWQCE